MDDAIFTRRWEQWLAMPADLGKWPGSDPELLRPKLEALCRLYLESTSEQRGRLIRLFQSHTPEGDCSRPNAWREFENLLDYATDRIPEIRATCDGAPLYLAIAALALQPEGGDYRDESEVRDALHDTAIIAGIDPAPYFEEVLAGATQGQRALMNGFCKPRIGLICSSLGYKIHPKTANLRAVLDQARAEAQRLHSDAVGTGHLVLGLLRFGVVEAVLRELGVDPQAVRVAVEAGLGATSDPDDRTATSEEWRRTPRAREVWELAHGTLQGQVWVGPENVLLGALRHGNNLAAEALHSVGITSYDQVQIATMKVIDEQGIAHTQYDPYQR